MHGFEDILDGYFPLRTSISDLMLRRKLHCASFKLSFAPVVDVEGLPHEAPIPLNIRSGRAGIIEKAELFVAPGHPAINLGGHARWRWLDGTSTPSELDPMTRLAEPALVYVSAVPSNLSPLESGFNRIRTLA